MNRMAGDKQTSVWPLSKFYFLVTIAGKECPFQEVSGLETETQPIEYRGGNSKLFSTAKTPGLKKGIFVNDDSFWKWYSAVKMNTVERGAVIIKLLDETGKATMTWTLQNALPTKITGTDLKADGNEVAIESIELAHEGLVISNT
jgi:phage tail-like protein